MKIYQPANALEKPMIWFYILFSLLFIQCTFTTTRIKSPAFSLNSDTLQSRLGHLISCRSLNLSGTEKKTNGVSTTELEIEIVNADHLPKQEDERISLAKMLSTEIKNDLIDTGAFTTYKVSFVSKKTATGMTISNSFSYVFNNQDLN